MKTFRMNIVTADGDFYLGEIEYCGFDTPDGKVGLLSGAMPRVCILSRGVIEMKTAVLQLKAHCEDGLVIVEKEGVTLLTSRASFDEENAEQKTEQTRSSSDSVKSAKAQIASAMSKAHGKTSNNQ